MSTITVGSFAFTGTFTSRGQSFTPNVSGPDGAGSVGDDQNVNLDLVTFGYPNATTVNRAGFCYLYDYVPTLADLNNDGTGSLAASTGSSDESTGAVFGANTFSRTWTFEKYQLDPTKKYYLFLGISNSLRGKSGNPYSGGDEYNGTLTAQTNDLQFQVTMDDDS
jgi:hypothetical protein